MWLSMGRPGGGSGIEYGKVKLFSSEESVESLKKVLDEILKKHKYPEEERYDDEDDVGDVEVSETPIDVEELAEVAAATEDEESPWTKARAKKS